MKVKIKDLKPNPFRRLKTYPIDEARVERLRQSIKHTGFWDNIVGRKTDGKVEIAYGHHRLIALQKEYSPDYELDVIIKPLDDARMIQVMADENDDLYKTTPAIINETVKVADDFLNVHPEYISKRASEFRRSKNPILRRKWRRIAITDFLSWDENKIMEALAYVETIKTDDVVKEVYEKFERPTQAREFRQARKKYPEVSGEKARKIAKDVREERLTIKDIKPAFREEKFKIHKPKAKDYLKDFVRVIPKINELNKELSKIVKHKECINGKGGEDFKWAVACLVRTLYKFVKGELK